MISGFDGVYNWVNPVFYSIIGLIFFGIGMAMVTIPLVPEILEAVEENFYYDHKSEEIENNNYTTN